MVGLFGGGVVLEESKHRLKRFKNFVLEELSHQEASLGSSLDLLDSILSRGGVVLQEAGDLARAVKCTRAETRESTEGL